MYDYMYHTVQLWHLIPADYVDKASAFCDEIIDKLKYAELKYGDIDLTFTTRGETAKKEKKKKIESRKEAKAPEKSQQQETNEEDI